MKPCAHGDGWDEGGREEGNAHEPPTTGYPPTQPRRRERVGMGTHGSGAGGGQWGMHISSVVTSHHIFRTYRRCGAEELVGLPPA